MAPQHNEIVKHLDDGFTVAWDTTKRDATTTKEVRKVVQERSTELGEIFGTVDLPARSGETFVAVETMSVAAPATPPRRRRSVRNAD